MDRVFGQLRITQLQTPYSWTLASKVSGEDDALGFLIVNVYVPRLVTFLPMVELG